MAESIEALLHLIDILKKNITRSNDDYVNATNNLINQIDSCEINRIETDQAALAELDLLTPEMQHSIEK